MLLDASWLELKKMSGKIARSWEDVLVAGRGEVGAITTGLDNAGEAATQFPAYVPGTAVSYQREDSWHKQDSPLQGSSTVAPGQRSDPSPR